PRTTLTSALFHDSAADDGDQVGTGSRPRIGEGAFDRLAELQAVARREAVLGLALAEDQRAAGDPDLLMDEGEGGGGIGDAGAGRDLDADELERAAGRRRDGAPDTTGLRL